MNPAHLINPTSHFFRKPSQPQRPKFNFDREVANFEINKKQVRALEVLDSGKTKFLLYGGAMGGGKSYFLRWYAVRFLLRAAAKGLKNVAVILACEDYPSLKDRQLSKILVEFPEYLGTFYSDHKVYGACYVLKPEYGSGVICFRNLDDPSKYQSAEFAAILIDELTKNTYETFNALRTRIRWPGLTDMECPFIAGTNPGGIGHGWVKQLWMDKSFPEEWIKPIDYRSAFAYIPSLADDNPRLDESYWKMLETLPVMMRKAFRYGDWNIFIGQAFPELSKHTHEYRRTEVPIPAYSFILQTLDWGFGKPFSVGWWHTDNDGRLYRFAEWYGWNGMANEGLRLTDEELADGILEREASLGLQGKTILRKAGPDCFNKKPNYKGGGQGPSTAEVFREKKLILSPGDPDRKLKIRQMRERLRCTDMEKNPITPMMLIEENCTHFFRTMGGLVNDPNNIEDVDTDGEDHCLNGEVKVITPQGELPIRSLEGTTGEILTPHGFKKYNRCWITRKKAPLVKITLESGRSIKCTKDHLFLNNKGLWREAKDLTDENLFVMIDGKYQEILCESKSSLLQLKSLMGKFIGNVVAIFKGMASDFIALFGNGIMAKFQKAGTFIIKTAIRQIIKLKTFLFRGQANTPQTTPEKTIIPTGLNLCTKAPGNGTGVQKGRRGIKNNIKNIANRPLFERVSSVVNAGRSAVYCFSLPHPHAFIIEGGLISHNCYDEACHACMARPLSTMNQPIIEVGIRRPPRDGGEAAELERRQIMDELRNQPQTDMPW